jgi:hypothetical protein
VGNAPFCPRCGADTRGVAKSTPSTQAHVPAPVQVASPAPRSVAPAALAGAAAATAIVLLAVIAFALIRNNNVEPPEGQPLAVESRSQSQAPPTTAPATTAPPTTAPTTTVPPKKRPSKAKPTPTTPPAPSGPGDVRTLQAGLFCRDLNAQGYSYVAAVDYWRMHGQPDQMDADLNGVPCETVYPASSVSAYWGEQVSPGFELGTGLLCRDLYARGLSYAEAVDYWWTEGAPDRMDEDLNGIPCETVYPAFDVDDFWY